MTERSPKLKDYSVVFREQLDSQRLQLSRDEQTWIERFETPSRDAKAVLNFGCAIQLTPYLMVETVAVLRALHVDFVAVAGPQWCCGQPYEDDAFGSAQNMTIASARRMAAFHPIETVHWCGAWWPRIESALADRSPFALTHVTAFLARTLLERADQVAWRTDVAGGVLLHLKSRDPMRVTNRTSPMAAIEASVPAALESIPGIRVAGAVSALSGGRPCEVDDEERGLLDRLSDAQVKAMREDLVRVAADAGATMVVTAHQACSREWGKLESQQLPVRHFVSLLAEALGVAQPARYHGYWRTRDVATIVAQAREAWTSWGMSEGEATAIARALFGRR